MRAKNVLREKNYENGLSMMFDIDSPMGKSIISAMKEYAKIKCTEQRVLCASLSSESWSTDEDGQEWVTNNNPSYDDIINAPEPDLS